ncbi:Lysozyme RrrD [Hartmannibacter diazotrophicus]|uniref:Lysozyme n=1 Tax=Hartmannibacter diazotrophicus TaxID=1482074 RepID=A0A2C9D5E6_9HYPH|nr:lysozyme [Hartmannibacter diazotrophicus]SON55547.1 Lysozyme RrrD [Hartmannibacter diazotrophicus]
MKLVEDWRRVAALSLSFWMQIAGIIVLIFPELRFYLTGQDMDPAFLWWLGILLLVAGVIGRLYPQGLSKWREWLRIIAVLIVMALLAFLLAAEVRASPVSEEVTLEIAVPFIAKKEGIRLKAYIPVPGDVPTICAGLTTINGERVKLGMTMTLPDCMREFAKQVRRYRTGLHLYFTSLTVNSRLTPKRDTAYTSLAFNCGIAAIGRSTAVRRLNAGDIRGGCEAITWWNKMGTRILRGLVPRRAEERDMCLAGL